MLRSLHNHWLDRITHVTNPGKRMQQQWGGVALRREEHPDPATKIPKMPMEQLPTCLTHWRHAGPRKRELKCHSEPTNRGLIHLEWGGAEILVNIVCFKMLLSRDIHVIHSFNKERGWVLTQQVFLDRIFHPTEDSSPSQKIKFQEHWVNSQTLYNMKKKCAQYNPVGAYKAFRWRSEHCKNWTN